MNLKDPGLLDGGGGSWSGSGHECPSGQHWDAQKNTCVDDIQVGNKPDGHDYQIQKASNVSGLDFTTVYQFDNAIDADNTYSKLPADGYWQMLVDGVMTKTNLPIDQRYEAVEKKKQEDYLKTIFSVEALNGKGGWDWIADFGSLADAKEAIQNIRNMTGDINASIPPSEDLRIMDKTGAIVYTDKGEVLQTVFWSVEQSPTTDMTRWVLRWGPGNTYESAKAQFADIIKVEPVDILRIVDSKGNVYDKYSPKTGAEPGPMAGFGGLMIGLALVVVLAGIGGVVHGTV